MYKVLLVDDEIWALKCIESVFMWSEYGFEIVGKTTSSTEALKMIYNLKPDVVFSDICMPVMSGLEIAEKIKNDNINTVVVFISGFDDFKYAQQAIRNNAFDYCLKPVDEEDAEQLLIRLKQHFDSQRQENNVYAGNSSDIIIEIQNSGFKKMIEHINEHYYEKLKLSDLSNMFYINTKYCCSLFNKYFNKSFSKYLNELRINKAIQLINSNKSTPINVIASQVGFGDYFHFSKVFKSITGMTPTQYKSQNSDDEL